MTSPVRIYDDTPAPSPTELTRWAAILDLPPLDWLVVRRLAGRVVAIGREPLRREPLRRDHPTWVLKSGVGERHEAAFQRTLASASLLDRLVGNGHAPWLSPPGVEAWRAGRDSDRALLAMPWQEGVPIATEGPLTGSATPRLLAEGVPRLAGVLAGLEALTSVAHELAPAPPFDRPGYQLRMTRRIAERLAVLVDADSLDAGYAAAVETGFRALLEDAPLAHGLCHGELTPYHVIDTRDGRTALIDLESMDVAGIRHVDLTVCAMRIWVLNEQPDAAQALVEARRRDLAPAAQRTFDAETHWQWVYAAVRTRQESMAWDARRAASSFWDWAMGPVLGHR